jgi:hypothetical protein
MGFEQQDRQCTYNGTLWHIRVTIFPAETLQRILGFLQYFLVHGMIIGGKNIEGKMCV